MKRWREILLFGILMIALTPLGFLLMPFVVIAAVIGALTMELKGLSH